MPKSVKTETSTKGRVRKAAGPKAPFATKPRIENPDENTASRASILGASGEADQRRGPARSSSPGPGVGARINRRAADRLRAGHLWVYASDIESLDAGGGDPPALLPVADNRGILLGTALYSPSSQIALRLVAREAVDEAGWLALLEERLGRAIDDRLQLLAGLAEEDRKSDSCRLCFSEADNIPGLVIDKYGELVIVQLLVKGLDSPQVREAVVRMVRQFEYPLHATTVLERPDPRIRELEGLAAPNLAPLWAADPEHPVTSTQFRLNGLKFFYDANAGQKTGAFLDQQANYSAAEQYAWRHTPGGRGLDVFCYQGGFALHLARVCHKLTGIDASRASLEVAERNLQANRDVVGAKEIDWIEGDAFAILRDWSDAHEQFDTIVLDPPAFAKSKRAVEGALRGYKELNLRALRMLSPGGLLITCSCSHHVGWADLESAVASAAADAHRRVKLLARRGAAPDHPVILNIPETEYLKCLVLQAD